MPLPFENFLPLFPVPRHSHLRIHGLQLEPLLFGPSWAAMEYELAGAMHRSLKAYWGRIEERRGANDFINPTAEVRVPPLLAVFASGFLQAFKLDCFEESIALQQVTLVFQRFWTI